jgi:hypothetical protein
MRRRTGMRQLTMFGVVCLAAFSLAPVARAGDDKCKDVSGRDVGTAVPAPMSHLASVLDRPPGV